VIFVQGLAPVHRGAEVAASGVLDLGTIVLDRGRTLTGRVRSEDGTPVAGALVRVGRSGPAPWQEARSDVDGRFVVEGLAADREEPATVRVESIGHVRQELACPVREDLPELDIVLARAIRLRAVVLDAEGLRVPRTWVTIRARDEEDAGDADEGIFGPDATVRARLEKLFDVALGIEQPDLDERTTDGAGCAEWLVPAGSYRLESGTRSVRVELEPGCGEARVVLVRD
jgi:hypothetical protein